MPMTPKLRTDSFKFDSFRAEMAVVTCLVCAWVYGVCGGEGGEEVCALGKCVSQSQATWDN